MSIKKPQSGYVGVTTHQPLIEPQGSCLDPLVNLTKCCRKSFTSICPKCPNNLPSVLRVQRYPLSKLHPSMTAAGRHPIFAGNSLGRSFASSSGRATCSSTRHLGTFPTWTFFVLVWRGWEFRGPFFFGWKIPGNLHPNTHKTCLHDVRLIRLWQREATRSDENKKTSERSSCFSRKNPLGVRNSINL